jgi:hypothetical protein
LKPITLEDSWDKARQRNCEVHFPGPFELFIDIDTHSQLKEFLGRVELLRRFWPCTWAVTPSPSGKSGHWHVRVQLEPRDNPLTEDERISYQSALGGDPRQTLHGLMQRRAGLSGVTRFFERKVRDCKSPRESTAGTPLSALPLPDTGRKDE